MTWFRATMVRAGLLLAIAGGMTACSGNARNEAAEASETVSADINATTTKAVEDTVNAMDAAGPAIANAASDVGTSAENAAGTTEGSLANAADAVDAPR